MAFNPFLGWSREDLEAELRSAQEDYSAGKISVESDAGDVRSKSLRESSAKSRIVELYKALSAIDSVAYPVSQITPIDRVRAVFSYHGRPCV